MPVPRSVGERGRLLTQLAFPPLMLAPDLSMAARFLDAVAGAEGSRHTFQTYAENERSDERDAFVCHGALTELAERLVDANDRLHLGVSVTINATDGQGRRYANMLYPRAVFLDFDHNAPPALVFDTANALVRTARGWHAYYWLSHVDTERPDWKLWEAAQAAAAAEHGCERIVDWTKAMRLPGLYHQKREPVLVELELRHPTRLLLGEVIDRLGLSRRVVDEQPAQRPVRRSKPAWRDISVLTTSDRLEQYERWVDEQPPAIEGSGGHDQLVRVIKMGHNFGLDRDDGWSVIERYNDRCEPPWRTRALRSQYASAWRGRFDAESFGSMLWVPRPEPRRVEGELPPEPPPEAVETAQRTVRRSGPRPPDPPPYEPDAHGPPPPSDDDAPFELRSAAGGDHGADGGDHDGGGGDHDDGLSWDGPPVNGHRVLSPSSPLESAKMFVRWRYVAEGMRTLMHFRKSWYVWKRDRFHTRSREAINERLYAFSEPAKVANHEKTKEGTIKVTYSRFHPDETKVNKMRHALESLTYLDDDVQPPCWIGQSDAERPDPRQLVACRNGLLHLSSGRFLGNRADYFNLNALGVDWDPEAPRPQRWMDFLEELWPEDVQAQALLQEWFGLCLAADTSFQKALLIVGPRRSGKGTIARILNALHGEHSNVAWPNLHALTSSFGLAPLLDKTVAIIPDLRVSNRIDLQQAVELILNITGEDWLQVDRKYLPPIQAQIPVRFLLMSNITPRLADAGGAFATRCLALRLEQSFLGREDRTLEVQLRKELPGILLWAIEGWRRLQKRGYFVQPSTAQEVLDELGRLSTPVQAFVEERCSFEADAEVTIDELFVQWRKWCEDEGRTAVGEKATLVRNLRAAYPYLRTSRPKAPTGRRIRCLVGLRIRYEDDEPRQQQRELPV
jgi:putative DNA primase/helicase